MTVTLRLHVDFPGLGSRYMTVHDCFMTIKCRLRDGYMTTSQDWAAALAERLAAANSTNERARHVRVISLHNTQSVRHAPVRAEDVTDAT